MNVENSNLKKSVIRGLIWKFSERFLAQIVTFVVSIILARILGPSKYGAIAIVNIFIALANVFVTAGFGNALIQKKHSDDTDFSTVFYFGILSGIALYAVVFFTAPYIAAFYDIEILCPVLRVMGLKLILASVNSVQHAYVAKHMMFRKFFWSTLWGTLISAVGGIVAAYAGLGIWSLVIQYMLNSFVDTVVLWFTVKWRPKKLFSFSRLKRLFSYGWKILVASLLRTGYKEIRGIAIGKVYSADDLAHYSKGKSFPSLVVTNIYTAVQTVIFPAMSKVQNHKDTLKSMTRRVIRIHSYVLLPMLIGLALVAEPLIYLLLGKEWLMCVPFLQAFCILSAFEPIQTANLQAIKAIGRSDIYLKLEIVKKSVGVVVLLVSLKWGVWAIAVGEILTEVFSALVNIYPNKKMIGYTYFEQVKDFLNNIIPLASMAVVVIALGMLSVGALPKLILQIIAGIVSYIGVSYFSKSEAFNYILGMIKSVKKKKISKGD